MGIRSWQYCQYCQFFAFVKNPNSPRVFERYCTNFGTSQKFLNYMIFESLIETPTSEVMRKFKFTLVLVFHCLLGTSVVPCSSCEYLSHCGFQAQGFQTHVAKKKKQTFHPNFEHQTDVEFLKNV